VDKFSSVPIRRITLHQFQSPQYAERFDWEFSQRYLVVFEIGPSIEEVATIHDLNISDLSICEINRLIHYPYGIYEEFETALGHRSTIGVRDKRFLRDLIDNSFDDVYLEKPIKGYDIRKEWSFIPKGVDEQFPVGVKSEPCFTIYDAALGSRQGVPIEVEREPKQPANQLPFPCEGATWKQISFVVKSKELVLVKTPKGEARVTYQMLGFADRRSGDKPIRMWATLLVFARFSGEISRENPHYERKLTDNARLLNKHLKKVFGINESIFTSHYRKEMKYKTKFTIRDDRII